MNKRKTTIFDLRFLARRRGGKCLTSTYLGNKVPHLWECKNRHRWSAAPNHIKEGHWCPTCAGNRRGTIQDIQKLASKRGGRCLSGTYVNAITKLQFECEMKHRWWATPNSVAEGSWCKQCAHQRNADRQRLTIEDLKRYAEKRGGYCLSTEYAHRDIKLEWECKIGHRWKATPLSVVMSHHWCQQCGIVRNTTARLAKNRLAELKEIAKSRNGRCISREYLGTHKPMSWRCRNGHMWTAKPADIMRGGWCPNCSSGIGERICREHFEQLFGEKFPRKSPPWLLNKSGNSMEMGGYSEELKLAFEHHGMQHYTTNNLYVTSIKALAGRRAADSLKRQLCRQHNITLVEIPEVPTKTSLNRLKSVIERQCKSNGVRLPKGFDTKPVNLTRAYSLNLLDEMKSLARMKGGWCLSRKFVD